MLSLLKKILRNIQGPAKNVDENGANAAFLRTVDKQIEENKSVIESLRDYDEGKKDISTTDVERRLHDIQTVA